MCKLRKLFLLPFLVIAFFVSINISPLSANNLPLQQKHDFLVTLETIKEYENSISAEEYTSYPQLREVVNEMKEIVSQSGSIPFSTLKMQLSGLDIYKAHLNDVAVYNESINYFTFSSKELEELRKIDDLAQEYYDFYQENGFFPIENEKNNNIRIASAAAATPVLAGLGINYSSSTLAVRLGTLGMIAAIDGPLPIGDFIALVAGVVIIGGYVHNYISTANAPSIVNNIKVEEGTTHSKSASSSIAMSKTVANNTQQYKHFEASPYNGWGGGVIVGKPIPASIANLRAFNGQNTYSYTYGDALSVAANGNDPGKTAVHHGAHKYENGVLKWPNNKPHWHSVKANWKVYAEAVVKAFCEFVGHKYKAVEAKQDISVNELTVLVNGKELAVKGEVKNGVTMVPVRAVAEAFGAKVVWGQTSYTVNITI